MCEANLPVLKPPSPERAASRRPRPAEFGLRRSNRFDAKRPANVGSEKNCTGITKVELSHEEIDKRIFEAGSMLLEYFAAGECVTTGDDDHRPDFWTSVPGGIFRIDMIQGTERWIQVKEQYSPEKVLCALRFAAV
jgi:hypothetical protein